MVTREGGLGGGTFYNLFPQGQSSISANTPNCIAIFRRDPNNFHYAIFMHLKEIERQTTVKLQYRNQLPEKLK